MAEENISLAPIIDIFKDDMYCWILDPNSTPNTNRFLLSKFIQENRITFAVDTGAANAYVIALKSTLTSYIAGQQFTFQATNDNTGASTINIDSISVKTIKRRDGTDLQAGDILSGSINIISYNGVNFQLLVSSGGGDWVSSLTTGVGSAIQNTVTSDITAQTTTSTFDALKWDIDVTGRTSTGEVNFFNFTKTDTGTTDVFKVDIEGKVTVPTSPSGIAGYFFGDGDTGIVESADDDISIIINGIFLYLFRNNVIRCQTSNSWTLTNEASTSNNATIVHNRTDLDTGTGGIAGEWSAIAGNIEAININASQITTTLSQLKTTASTTLAAINIGSFAGDPSALVNGDAWYNSTTEKFMVRENGVSLDWRGTGTSSGANNEIQTSDGSGGFTSDKIFANNGILTLGDGTLSGARSILTNSSDANADLILKSNGTGQVVINNGSNLGGQLNVGNLIDGVVSRLFVQTKKSATLAFVDSFVDGVSGESNVDIRAATADAWIRIGEGSNYYALGLDRTDSSQFKIGVGGSTVTPSNLTEVIGISTSGQLGFFATTPISQPSAYTRNATIVEDKTLLASASATTINNNNVLAALINDLQLLGLVA